MSDTLTTYLGLTKPAVGSSRDTWGAKVNADLDLIDEFVGTGLPIGAILDFAGPSAPPGWLICDGRLVSRVTYAALFAVISTYWGAGDGSTTFALPPTPGRASVGPGTVTDQNGQRLAFSFTQTYGLVWNQITQAYLPSYNMQTDTQGYHSHGGATAPGANHIHGMDTQGIHSHGGTTWGTSNDHTHLGSTDGQGNHSHTVSAWGAVGGGAAVAAGGIATGAAIATSTDGFHAHNIATGGQSADHTHVINQDPGHQHNIFGSGNLVLGIYPDGNHLHNVNLGGGGQLFEVLSPVLVVTKIIYAGQQAVTRVLTAAAPTRRLSAPMRGSH